MTGRAPITAGLQTINDDECEGAGIDRAKVRRYSKQLADLLARMKGDDICIFAGEGSITVRPNSGDEMRQRLILAHIGCGNADGGANACGTYGHADGLERGE